MSSSSPRQYPVGTTSAPPSLAANTYTAIVCTPDQRYWSFPLKSDGRYVIGRDASSDIVLDFPWVSLRHAMIVGGDPPEIVDLESRNGTTVNFRTLEPARRHPLPPGSVVAIAGILLMIQRGTGSEFRARAAGFAGVEPVAAGPTEPAPALLSASLLTRDPRMQELCALVRQIAESDVSVLVLGETGVGKELFARALHETSPRRTAPLVVLNCAAIPDNLFESELFGYERGAFSGAFTAKPGLFEVANGSTLFLDEIGELPSTVQPKLLRVLETGEVSRLGSVRPTQVDVRVVAATNRDLDAAIASGEFRMDLFYRLNGISIAIPPLRERPCDILELANHFAVLAAPGGAPSFAPEAVAALTGYHWPGNVRELKSVIKRAVLLARGETIDARHLAFAVAKPLTRSGDRLRALVESPAPASDRSATEDEVTPWSALDALAEPESTDSERREQRRIQEALERTGGNQKDAAKLLGISRRTLIKRLDRYAMTRPRKRRLPSRND